MTEHELEPKIIELDTDVLKITEQSEPYRLVLVESTKRVEKFQIIKSNPRSIFFKVLYESGKSIPEVSGNYTTQELALKALIRYLARSKPTKEAKYKERWGDKEIPELKLKKRPRKKKELETNAFS